ncbi:MAG: hypothetical protein AB2693_23590, partial [Candidatus Thiodiazotropha sp.]
ACSSYYLVLVCAKVSGISVRNNLHNESRKFSETVSISIKTSTPDIKWEINDTKRTKFKSLRAASK